jgi:hypothetical protein
MKFSPLLQLFAGAALVIASPVLEKKAADVLGKRAEVITPKVFIISMV